MVNNSGNQSDASQVRQSWVKYDGIMDEKLECVSDILFRSIGTPEGLRFLDIGCGAGSTTIRLGKLVSSTASVTGIDISEPMVSFARGKAKGKEPTQIHRDLEKFTENTQGIPVLGVGC
jgi:ubiquinone/menaquinone biosynthesis C-methylase UbiE